MVPNFRLVLLTRPTSMPLSPLPIRAYALTIRPHWLALATTFTPQPLATARTVLPFVLMTLVPLPGTTTLLRPNDSLVMHVTWHLRPPSLLRNL